MQDIADSRRRGVGVVVIEGAPEWEAFVEAAGADGIDLTEVVAAYFTNETGDTYIKPFANKPAAVLYTTNDGDHVLAFAGISSGSGVMAPFVQASTELGAANAAKLHALATLLRCLFRPGAEVPRFAESVFGTFVGQRAAQKLVDLANELGLEYKTPSQRGGEHSQAYAERTYE